MPIIAYQNAHGANDFPLHFAFFEALERRGILDRYDFALDPFNDVEYCRLLIERFPQLVLTTEVSFGSRARELVYRRFGRGAKAMAAFERGFDAVCEAPGGRIHPLYTGGLDIFWRYPRTARRAILFHSIESGILEQDDVRRSVAQADLVITRSKNSAVVARHAGADASKVVESCDIVFSQQPYVRKEEPGLAVALRVPNVGATPEYLHEMGRILDYLESLGKPIDHTRLESPLDREQISRGYGSAARSGIRLCNNHNLYKPFSVIREAIISCRLHTTIIAILAGNRRVLQLQIESRTSKISEIMSDIGLSSLTVYPLEKMKVGTFREFIEKDHSLDATEVSQSLATARSRVDLGLNVFEEWLSTLR